MILIYKWIETFVTVVNRYLADKCVRQVCCGFLFKINNKIKSADTVDLLESVQAGDVDDIVVLSWFTVYRSI